MALLGNGFRETLTGKMFGRTLLNGATPHAHEYRGHMAACMRNQFAGEGITDDKASVPSGVRHPVAWVMARKNGAMASRNNAVVTFGASGSGASGFAIDGTADIVFTVPDAEGRLVTGGTGTATMTFSATGGMFATLGVPGSASMSFTTNAPVLRADGFMGADAPFAVNAAIASYAKGYMAGSTVDSSTLTTDAIIAAMNASPPKVNIAKVNDVTVTGTGAPGTEWGPA